MTPQSIIEKMKLQPNPIEGGYFGPIYTSTLQLDNVALPGFKIIPGKRSLCSAIYYFLQAGDFSALHRVTGDMLYHFYMGDPVEMLMLYANGGSETCLFDNDISRAGNSMKIIPGGTWLGSKVVSGGRYALMGVTMAPGFNETDYEIGKRETLQNEFSEQATLIEQLTRS